MHAVNLNVIRGRVAEMTSALGVDMPVVALGKAPSGGAQLRTDRGVNVGGRPIAMLTVDADLPSLEPSAQDGLLAWPLVAVALDQPTRRQRRNRKVALVGAMALIVAMAPLRQPVSPPWALVIDAPCLGLLVGLADLAWVRASIFETDRKIAEVFGTSVILAALRHIEARPPEVSGWRALLIRALPSPPKRLSRLKVGG
jgi:hypothetical protein